MKNLKKALSLLVVLVLLLQLLPVLPASAEEEILPEDVFPSEMEIQTNAVCIQDGDASISCAPDIGGERKASDGAEDTLAYGDEFLTDDLLRYRIRSGKATVVGIIQDEVTDGVLEIPESIDGYPVTAIGERAFAGGLILTKLVVPGSVRIIEDYAFEKIQADSVVLQEGLEILSYGVFHEASIRSDLQLPASLREIRYSAFNSCSGFDTLTILSDNIAYIGNFESAGFSLVYGRSDAVEEAVMDTKPSSSDSSEEGETSKIRYVNLDTGLEAPSSPTTITVDDLEYKLYASHAKLSNGTKAKGELEIPEAVEGMPVTAVGNVAFSNGGSLTSVIIPDSVTRVDSDAFSGCYNLRHIDFGDGIRVLPHCVCHTCVRLESVVFPRYLESIGSCAFQGDKKLGRIALPDTLKCIKCYAFANCPNLQIVS